MFSILAAATKYVLGYKKTDEPDISQIIARLNAAQKNADDSLIDANTESDNNPQGCFYKAGVVTKVAKDHVLVDRLYICEKMNVSVDDLKTGDKVNYMAYRRNRNSTPIIRRIISRVEENWDFDEFLESKNEAEVENEGILKQVQTMRRKIVAKVTNRNGRLIFLEPVNISVNLDEVNSTFIPCVGDWLHLEALVEVDETSGDLGGEVLEVDNLQPLRSKLQVGKVTQWTAGTGLGTVERKVAFNKASCEPGYEPRVGDKVVVDCLESDQDLQTWRALTVVPLVQVSQSEDISESPVASKPDFDALLTDKYGIVITSDASVNLNPGEEKELTVKIENTGNIAHTLIRASCANRSSQLYLLWPKGGNITRIYPMKSVSCVFRCNTRNVGCTEELLVFTFKGFKIGRLISVNVIPKSLVRSSESRIVSRSVKPATKCEFDQEFYVKGVRPLKPSNFMGARNEIFRVPQRYWAIVLPLYNERMSRMDREIALSEAFPFLTEGLTFQNYTTRFHALLYLEEISLVVDLQRYDIESAVLRPRGEYLALTVPGLAEKRPSLIAGDRAIVSFNWDHSGGRLKYEGFVHKVQSSEALLKFNEAFHSKYNMEECQVRFKSSYSSIGRCHSAVNLAIQNLGSELLFPTKVNAKEAQINLDEEGLQEKSESTIPNQDGNGNETNDVKYEEIPQLKKRSLVWYNQTLNHYQKQAVRNILKGVARPLPYVIFGPPGTGKSITLCETALQILTTLPESRLLIATPSNSSANLIAERLLDSGVLKPGDLVRLVAHHCLDDDSIPERLLPFCATGNLAGVRSTTKKFDHSPDKPKINCTTSVLGRHRITVGTCIALGQLHNMGFPRGHFSHILVDEAGQATEPEIMVPLSFVLSSYGQIVLAGDPMQLGPVVNSDLAANFGLSESFLSRLLRHFPYQRDPEGFETGYAPRLITKLVMNYRSLPEILELPNALFYDSELKAEVSDTRSPEAELLRSLAEDLPKREGQPPAIVFHGITGENIQDEDSPSWYNPAEASQVYLYLLKLYERGFGGDDVGIITPYKKQVRHIRDLLMELDLALPMVGTVEEFQGQERKVIILSTVRSTTDFLPEDIKHALGFVASPKRLNVAITRARVLLIILGNAIILRSDPYWRSVINYCVKKGGYTACDLAAYDMTEDLESTEAAQ